jgi:hypothetical protein
MDGSGLCFTKDLSYDDWEELGERVKLLARCGMFVLGDWINYGEDNFGEKYSQALDVTDFTYGTLRNVAYVCRKVPKANRNDMVSFSHHAEVARLPEEEQVAMLEKTSLCCWSVKELRSEVAHITGDEEEQKNGTGTRGDSRDALIEIGRRMGDLPYGDLNASELSKLTGFLDWLKVFLTDLGIRT